MTGKTGDTDRVGEELAEHLRRVAQAESRQERRHALDKFAQAVAGANAADAVYRRLLGGDVHSQRLALELAARLPPADAATVERVVALLPNRALSIRARLRAAAQLLSVLPPYERLSNEILQGLIAGVSKRKAFERLRLLQAQLPDYPSLAQLCRELEEGLLLACPRCAARQPRPQMVTHLWREHRLILEGDRVRDPWQLIDGWLRDYAGTGASALLDRSFELGRQLDPEGLVRVQRLLLANGLSDEEARANLQSKAAAAQGTLCPHCFAVVSEAEEPPAPLIISRGRLAGRGYEVRIDDHGLGNHLTITTPAQVVFDAAEPSRHLTRRGAVLLQVAPVVLIALGLAAGLPPEVLPPLAPTALFLLIALLAYIRVRLALDPSSDPTERAIEHAWTVLAPRLYRPTFARDDATFLAGLARASIGVGDPATRDTTLERISKWTQAALVEGRATVGQLVPLKRLELEDAAATERDPIALLASQVGHCFARDVPVALAEELLASLPVGELPQTDRARLRVLVLARAFEVGLEALDLQELGRVYPFLGQAYASEDLDGMTRLRWLTLVKSRRPWRRIGSATVVYELARYPTLGAQYLRLRPDLLLFHAGGDADDEDEPASAPILICEEGVLYRDILIDEPDTKIEVASRSSLAGGGYELRVGRFRRSFQQDPERLGRRLQGWMRYLFRDLLPNAKRLRPARSGLVEPLLRQKLVTCPECARPFLSMRGEIGIPWEGSEDLVAESAAS